MATETTSGNKAARIRGLLLTVMGGGLLKWQVYDPLHAGERKMQSVSVSAKWVGAGIILPILGLALLIFGAQASRWFSEGLSFRDWKSTIRVVVLAAVCLLCYKFVIQSLSAQGFHQKSERVPAANTEPQ